MSKYYKFQRARVSSNASHYRFYFSYKFPWQKRFAQLAIHKTPNSGWGFSHRIFRQRGRLLKRFRTPSIAYIPRVGGLGFVGDIQLFTLPYKFLSLVILTSGITFYTITSNEHRWFSIFRAGCWRRARGRKFSFWYGPLIRFPKLSLVHSIEVDAVRGSQFVRSMGAKCVYFLIDLQKRTAVMKLPSKETKTMPIDNHVSLGLVIRTEKKYYPNTKCGFYVRNGRKPVTRGVARNPVDHPHGGRTKSVKNQLTPWGFTTKGR